MCKYIYVYIYPSLFYFFYSVVFKHLKLFLRDGGREEGEHALLSIDSFPKCSQWPWVNQVDARSQGLDPGLLRGWQKHSYLIHHHCCPGSVVSKKLELWLERRLEKRHSDIGCLNPIWCLNH